MVAKVGTLRNPSIRGISGSLRAGAVSGSIALMLVIVMTGGTVAQRAPQARDRSRVRGESSRDPAPGAGQDCRGLQRSHQRRERQRWLGTDLRGRTPRPREDRRQGRQGAAAAVSRPHQDQPARHRRADRLRRAGPLLDRLPSQLPAERIFLRALRVAAIQRRRRHRPLPGGHGQSQRDDAGTHQPDIEGAPPDSAALLQPQRRADRVRSRRVPLHRQRRRRLGRRSARRRAGFVDAAGQDAAHRREHAR